VIPKTFYTDIAESGDRNLISMMSEKEGNLMTIDRQSIVFTKNAYPNNGHVDLDTTFKQFMDIFRLAQQIVKFKGIRRIGLVAEHRFNAVKNNNIELLNNLTKVPAKEFPGHFMLHYESRTPSSGSPLDTVKGAFTNTICDFYDSSLDTSVPVAGMINANLDYQRYFAPSLDTKIAEEAEKHFFGFKKELIKFDLEITKLGLKK
jgi:hypothetical protein